jgi:hypothetical protein
MAYMNAEQRAQLAQELVQLKFNQAKWRLRRMDAQGRLAFFRNTQQIGGLVTRFVLPTYGVSVTLVENYHSEAEPESSKLRAKNSLREVIVEPTADNRT